jgi:CRP-like cAMP-binding protein
VAKETITNYSEPTHDTRLEVDVGASYDTPPNEVKAVIARALRAEPLLVATREPEILIADFAASSITYRVRVWTADFAADMRVRDRVRSHIYYAFRRHGINIPYPIQVQIDQSSAADDDQAHAQLLDGVEIFASLTDEQRVQLAMASRPLLFAAGQVIVREDEAGTTMFVLKRGEASVTLAQTEGELARLREGAFFGEMSLLTGDPRSATVTAVTDCELIEIGADAFRSLVLADAALVDHVTAAVANRRIELEQHRTSRSVDQAPMEPPQTLIARVRRFLRL